MTRNRIINLKRKCLFIGGIGLFFLVPIWFFGMKPFRTGEVVVPVWSSNAQNEKKKCVVIDAGHGGEDPGKVGSQGILEKDINLMIARRVQQFLQQQDVEVVMTRQEDCGVYRENDKKTKAQDMKNRVELIENRKPDLTVSIHQNSYPQEDVKGAQVFFYTGSQKSECLANKIQNRIQQKVDWENRRQTKENHSYYLLKKTKYPIVIVECGFLTNQEEAEKLCLETYQKRIAWAITMGILQYLEGE